MRISLPKISCSVIVASPGFLSVKPTIEPCDIGLGYAGSREMNDEISGLELAPASEEISIQNMPRPYVPARSLSLFVPRILSCDTKTFGRPFMSGYHVIPPSADHTTPFSVPRNKFPLFGFRAIHQHGRFGSRFVFKAGKVFPLSLLTQKWLPATPQIYTFDASLGSDVIPVM